MATYSAIVYIFDTGIELIPGDVSVYIDIGSVLKIGIPYITIDGLWKTTVGIDLDMSSAWKSVDT